MTERTGTDMSKVAWQSQPIESPTISLAFIRHHATKLHAQFRREMHMVHGVVVLGVVVSLVALFNRTPEMSTAMAWVTGLGVVLAIAGFICVLVQARRRGGPVAIQPEDSVTASLNAYRAELQRGRDYYLGTWRWSIGPLLPSVAVFLIGGFWFDPRPQSGLRFGLLTLFVIVFSLLGALDHRRKAKAFQDELDTLDGR